MINLNVSFVKISPAARGPKAFPLIHWCNVAFWWMLCFQLFVFHLPDASDFFVTCDVHFCDTCPLAWCLLKFWSRWCFFCNSFPLAWLVFRFGKTTPVGTNQHVVWITFFFLTKDNPGILCLRNQAFVWIVWMEDITLNRRIFTLNRRILCLRNKVLFRRGWKVILKSEHGIYRLCRQGLLHNS